MKKGRLLKDSPFSLLSGIIGKRRIPVLAWDYIFTCRHSIKIIQYRTLL